MNKIVVLGEKHDKRIFVLKSGSGYVEEAEELQRLALHIFRERDTEEWYYTENMDKIMERYYLKARTGDAKSALTFVRMRSDQNYEYESFEVTEPETWE